MLEQIKKDIEDGVRVVAIDANLSGANLSGADLSYADLRGANLSGADLSGADLSYADLRYADLSGADLSGADLSYADLRGANLSGADLSGADLSYADLRGANLSGADLSYADLSGANLRGANLTYADLSGANLRGANLSGANLSGAKGFGVASPESFSLIEKIADIVLANKECLSMDSVHSCETTHCLAGWVCHLNPVAKTLDSFLGWNAAACIVVPVPEFTALFFAENDVAIDWLRRFKAGEIEFADHPKMGQENSSTTN